MAKIIYIEGVKIYVTFNSMNQEVLVSSDKKTWRVYKGVYPSPKVVKDINFYVEYALKFVRGETE